MFKSVLDPKAKGLYDTALLSGTPYKLNWGLKTYKRELDEKCKAISSHDYTCVCAKSAQSCPTLCVPIDCSLLGSSVHGILQAKMLEWVAILFSRGSSPSRDWILVSCIAGKLLTIWTTKEVQGHYSFVLNSRNNLSNSEW